jgi:hypothetical protein
MRKQPASSPAAGFPQHVQRIAVDFHKIMAEDMGQDIRILHKHLTQFFSSAGTAAICGTGS